MFDTIQQKNFQDFVTLHQQEDVKLIALRFHGKTDFDLSLALQQIQGLQKSKSKLPVWHSTPLIVFPPDLNLQQSSSEKTGSHKAGLLRGINGLDLTGGFGVDTHYLSKKFNKFTYVEPDRDLFGIAQHNFRVLRDLNIACINTSSEDFLNSNIAPFDWIYLDPSRRKEGKQVIMLEDYSPDVVALQDKLLDTAPNILVKTSPVLDITDSARKLRFVKEIHVVAVQNEVKEVLYLMERHFSDKPRLICTDLKKSSEHQFIFSSEEESNLVPLGMVRQFLYEPNASIMKAGGFNSVGNRFGLKKLHRNTHLYTSETLVKDFPGRIFNIESTSKFDPKALKKLVPDKKANIAVRNFTYSVEKFRKMTGIKDGGEVYLFGITDIDNKPLVLVCSKV